MQVCKVIEATCEAPKMVTKVSNEPAFESGYWTKFFIVATSSASIFRSGATVFSFAIKEADLEIDQEDEYHIIEATSFAPDKFEVPKRGFDFVDEIFEHFCNVMVVKIPLNKNTSVSLPDCKMA
jgi:hypothetical protein